MMPPGEDFPRRRRSDRPGNQSNDIDLLAWRIEHLDESMDKLSARIEGMPDRFAISIGVATQGMSQRLEDQEQRIRKIEDWRNTVGGALGFSGHAGQTVLVLVAAVLGAVASHYLG